MQTQKTDTYVLYVGVGREDVTSELIGKLVPEGTYSELFSPKFEKRIKRAGIWRTVEAPLVPGYLFVVTDDEDMLLDQLRSVPAITKVLGMGPQVVALGEEETVWLDRLTKPNERTVGFSEGYIVGDRVKVMSGPLVGYESEIVKVDRRKRFGYLTFCVAGRDKQVKVGLEIVSKIKE